ncbi:stress-responsive transcription factor hsf1 [Apophysomyces ossiformis]|uniref:Stress-responsive transcription factor hsf1 n=1 Tax=Apophysomyces ossiformis TaxID=679940 RepID=A0A8H7BYZ3_9FUNG|nr:stress-responsive transcription factor hsf1 [Apophysomyces ossiformis]
MRGLSSPHQSSRSPPSSDYDRQKVVDDESLRLLIHPSPDVWSLHAPYPTLNSFRAPDRECVDSTYTAERGIAGFVSKLYQCLQAPPEDGVRYVRWCTQDGKDMFVIDCIPKFTEVVLPHLFKHCKFASFVRQLNIYGFQRDTDARKSKDTKDKESCRWFHPYFRPGGHNLFHLIRRRTPRYSRRRRVKAEEDVETVVQTESGDESENDDLMSESRRSSSASSTAAAQLDTVLEEAPLTSKEAATQTQPREDEDMREQQDLCMQLSQLKQACRKMQKFFTEQLTRADVEIEGQRLRIEQLESMLRMANVYPPAMQHTVLRSASRIKTEASGPFVPPAQRIQPTSTPPPLSVSSNHVNYGFLFPQDNPAPADWMPSYCPRRGSTPTTASATVAAPQLTAVSSSASLESIHSDLSPLDLAYAGLPM